MNDAARRGTVLVIVTGVTCMLLALAVTFLARIRSDGQEMRLILQEAQARLMLHAGLMYVQEGSRLGWGPDRMLGGKLVAGDESWGWTDVRDGSLGPRGARPVGASPSSAGLPQPTWWRTGWPVYTPYPGDNELPAVPQRVWPCPGSGMRCAMGVPARAPYAIRPLVAGTPVTPPADYADPTAWAADWGGGWPSSWNSRIYGPSSGALGMLDPQPVAGTLQDFRSGQLDGNGRVAMISGSEHLGWFRLYRETLADHDNDGRSLSYTNGTVQLVDGTFDRVALYDPANPAFKNWNAFVITCGAGATRGYRFWDLPANDPRRAIEPVTARESGHWDDSEEGRRIFEFLRSEERILWYRFEWTGQDGGGLGGNQTGLGESVGLNWRDKMNYSLRDHSVKLYGGGIKWIQRLANEPPNW